MSVMPMRCITRACWLCRGRSSISVSPVATVCALAAKLPHNKTPDNKTSRRPLYMEFSFMLPGSDSQRLGFEIEITRAVEPHAVALRRIGQDYVSGSPAMGTECSLRGPESIFMNARLAIFPRLEQNQRGELMQ